MSISPTRSGLVNNGPRGKKRTAFSLVEVALALGILGVGLVAMVGLISVGLNGSRENINRSAETQIVDWVQSVAKAAHQGNSLYQLDPGPHQFDRSGLYLLPANSADSIYSASLVVSEKSLPGSQEALLCVEITLRARGRDNQILARNALWFQK